MDPSCYLESVRYMCVNTAVYLISEKVLKMFKPGNDVVETPGLTILIINSVDQKKKERRT